RILQRCRPIVRAFTLPWPRRPPTSIFRGKPRTVLDLSYVEPQTRRIDRPCVGVSSVSRENHWRVGFRRINHSPYSEVVSMGLEHASEYTSALRAASDKVRWALYAVFTASTFIAISNYNVQAWSWPARRLATWYEIEKESQAGKIPRFIPFGDL